MLMRVIIITIIIITIIKFPNAVMDRNKPEGQMFLICASISSPQNICAFPYTAYWLPYQQAN
jgi:hypothetical protein